MARNDTVERIFIKVKKEYYVYIMTNSRNTVLYTGVTNDLKRRVYEHKSRLIEGFSQKVQPEGFSKKYNLTKLVYYEACGDIEGVIIREKQIKGGSRQDKIDLVNSSNRDWRDLFDAL